ncbi:MAG: hypothetical protein KME13_00045 [Myxacorys californica WJT36-NPBG1]|jgi:DNA-binding response OmpR family regulator|nr:hypothetical protein [Myxacorys californica WJT36-NPBG1]
MSKKIHQTILLIESDDETRPLLQANLQGWGYQVIATVDEKDAIAHTSHANGQIDLILINQVGFTIEDYINVGRRIQRSLNLLPTPVVILAEGFSEDLEGRTIQVGKDEYVMYMEVAEQLITLLRELLPR